MSSCGAAATVWSLPEIATAWPGSQLVRLTDSEGQVVASYDYDAWGNLEAGADQPGYAFTGREWDPETGLYYYRARYYDARTARFLSEDPLGAPSSRTLYGYVLNRPTSLIDPSGLTARSKTKTRERNGPIPAGRCPLGSWACTWPEFSFRAGQCSRRPSGKWGFDADVFWTINTVYARPRRTILKSGETLEMHELNHQYDLEMAFRPEVINRKIQTEGFSCKPDCDAAHDSLMAVLIEYQIDVTVESGRKRD